MLPSFKGEGEGREKAKGGKVTMNHEKESQRRSAASIGGNGRYSADTERARERERERERQTGGGAHVECGVSCSTGGLFSAGTSRARKIGSFMRFYKHPPRRRNPLYFQGIRVADSLTKGRERLLIGRDPWEFFNIRVALLVRELLPALFTTHA